MPDPVTIVDLRRNLTRLPCQSLGVKGSREDVMIWHPSWPLGSQRGLDLGSCGQGVTWRVVSVLVSFIAVRDRRHHAKRWLNQRRPTVNRVTQNLPARGRRFDPYCPTRTA